MPNAPNHSQVTSGSSPDNRFTAYSLVASGPGVLWGAYAESGLRSNMNGLFRTVDNGQTWQQIQTSSYGSAYAGETSVDFSILDSNTAWVLTQVYPGANGATVISSILKRTTTGPSGFSTISTTLPALFVKLHFFSATTGIALAAPSSGSTNWGIYRTTDSGISWAAVPSSLPAVPTSTGFEGLKTKYAHGAVLWVATQTGNVLRTADSGLTWTSAPTGLGTSLSGIAFRDELNGLAYGANAQLARSHDGGHTWLPIANSLPANVTTLVPQGALGTYVCASAIPTTGATYSYRGALATSTDDGATWQTRFTDNLAYAQLASGPDGQLWAATTYQYFQNSPPQNTLLRYVGSPLATKSAVPAAALAYPNPTTGPIRLSVKGGSTVQVHDAVGRLHVCPGSAEMLDLSALATGLYLITITEPTGTVYTQRISVVR